MNFEKVTVTYLSETQTEHFGLKKYQNLLILILSFLQINFIVF